MKANWHIAFLVLAFLIALFPPTVTNSVLDPSPSDNGGVHIRPVYVFSMSNGIQEREWQAMFALELPCLFAFAVFGLRKRS
ncbi:MAG TPA: hypothetical protein VGL56_13725 [Fimbriimonadaceae bacterium]|jgi:hypothetical protein